MPIIGLQRRLAETGRIRIGAQVAMNGTTKSGRPRKRPARLETFRLTSPSKPTLDLLAERYGGKVVPWADAPTGRQWELFTEADTLSIMVPPEAMAFSQWYELWSGGGCQRRCNGFVETIGDRECVCDPEDRECKPHTRLSVMIAEVPASGMWRLDTQGYYAATEMGGAFELARLVSESTGAAILRGTLRLDQREVKRPDEAAKQFVVPVLQFDLAATAAAPSMLEAGDEPETRGLRPIAGGTHSLAEGFSALETPTVDKPRRNAAATLPPTGVDRPAPRQVIDVDAEDVPGGPQEAPGARQAPADAPQAQPAATEPPAALVRLRDFIGLIRADEREAAELSKVWDQHRLPSLALLSAADADPAEIQRALEVLEAFANRGPEAEDFTEGDDELEPVSSARPPRPSQRLDEPQGAPARSRGTGGATRGAKPTTAITPAQVGKIMGTARDKDVEPHDFASKVLGRAVESLNDLTKAEASKIIDHLLAEGEGTPEDAARAARLARAEEPF